MIWTIMQTLNVSALEAVLVNGPLVLCDGLGRGGVCPTLSNPLIFYFWNDLVKHLNQGQSLKSGRHAHQTSTYNLFSDK